MEWVFAPGSDPRTVGDAADDESILARYAPAA